ncbi:hypothetical protein [Mesobacillus sp. S13]|uniref:hypothetical protein n=1 Tax=Mesobacillus sp. S13 TaxID=2880221 RepID=UPI001CF2A78E|nr:hypothetical protein [Mesobacillus sp. S13]
MKKRETVVYELSSGEFNLITKAIYKVRKYHDADGAESPDLLEEALTDLEVIFDDVEKI